VQVVANVLDTLALRVYDRYCSVWAFSGTVKLMGQGKRGREMGTGKIEKLRAQELGARKLKGHTFSVVARLRLCGRYEPMSNSLSSSLFKVNSVF